MEHDLNVLRDRVVGYLRGQEREMVAMLQTVVDIDSGTGHAPGLNAVAEVYARGLGEAGVDAAVLPERAGNHVLGMRGGRGAAGGPSGTSLVIGHMDTVFPVGTVAARPFRIADGRAYGPGVEDMKSGLVCAVFAARTLTALDLWPEHEVVFFFNSDEEIRSPSSSALFAREGGRAAECYVLEGARDDGSVVTARKGSARFQLKIAGKASHSGAAHSTGRSAIRALAHKILALEALTDYEVGTTVNVGVCKGGTTFNTVPGEAWCDVDIRVLTPETAQAAVSAVHAIAAREDVPGTWTIVEGGITRPPMVRTERNVKLFHAVRAIAATLGRDLRESLTGGGSDGCLTAAAGAPTLDGLGPQGGGAHTADEFINLDSLVPCAAMLAMALATGPHTSRR